MDLHTFRGFVSQVRVECPPFIPQKKLIQIRNREQSRSGWSVYNLRRAAPEAPSVAAQGERGMYFDFIKQQNEKEKNALDTDSGKEDTREGGEEDRENAREEARTRGKKSGEGTSSESMPPPKRVRGSALDKFMK